MEDKQQWNGKSRGGALGTTIFVKLTTICGPRVAYVLLLLVIPYFVFFAPKASRASYKYHRKILHRGVVASFGAVFFHFYTFGRVLVDRIAVRHGLTHFYTFKRSGEAEVMQLIDQKRGAILLGAHVGAWEIGPMMSDRYASKINVAMIDAEYQAVKRVIENGVDILPYNIIPIKTDGLESVLQIKQAIDRGELVSFLSDRYLQGHDTIDITLMEKPAKLPAGVFKIATRLRVPVVLYSSMRDRGLVYNFSFKTIDSKSLTPQKLAELYAEYLEELIKQYPDQWFNLYDFWRN